MNKTIDAVWVLSGPEYKVDGENKSRIDAGINHLKKNGINYIIFNGV